MVLNSLSAVILDGHLGYLIRCDSSPDFQRVHVKGLVVVGRRPSATEFVALVRRLLRRGYAAQP
jgi:hypothetical protein